MINLNIVYTSQEGPAEIVYENHLGKVWMSATPNNEMANIAMNSYSAISTKENDSLFVIEPICVLERNYNIKFVNKFRYIFTWATKPFEKTKVANKTIYVNLPSFKGNPQIDSTKWLPWDERSNEIVFIANNKHAHHKSELYSLRLKLADWLHANSQFKVSWYGNMPVRRPYYKGSVEDKLDVLGKVKFHVCMENSYDPIYSANFLSEKMPAAWFAGAIPIYMGCSNLDELGVSKECYIDLLPLRYDFPKLEAKLKEFTAQDYSNMIESYTELSDDMHRLTSYEHVFDTMLKAYHGMSRVVEYSVGRSGATLVKQALQKLMPGIDVDFTHDPVERQPWPAIIVYRDFRDVLVSHWRVHEDINFEKLNSGYKIPEDQLDKYLDIICERIEAGLNYTKEQHPEALLLKYELFHNDFYYLFNKLEAHFNKQWPDSIKNKKWPSELKYAVKDYCSLEANKKRQEKMDTFKDWDDDGIHGLHIYKGEAGTWRHMIDEKHHAKVNERLRPYLEEWGYEVS